MLDDPDDYNAAVASMAGIDRWCTSTDWVVPLLTEMDATAPFVIETAHGWGVFDRVANDSGQHIVMGVDRVWGFACPIVGAPDVWPEIAMALDNEPWDLLLIPGLVENSATWSDALHAFGRTHRLQRAGSIVRQRLDLSNGFDAWFNRRSPRHRQQLRRLTRDAEEAGIEVIDAAAGTESGALIDRLVAIETTSWKGADDDGLCAPPMQAFYRRIVEQLGPARTRCLIARCAGRDVGYIVGGVRGSTYRGLQLSYAEDVRHLNVGHLLQRSEIERASANGIDCYDLGMDIAYKQRWSDRADATTVLAVVR